jgi:uncharacterized protein YegP (UPF0339 family)
MVIEMFSSRGRFGLSKLKWYFRIRAKNGETVAQSEGYSRKVDAVNTVMLIIREVKNAEIREATRK